MSETVTRVLIVEDESIVALDLQSLLLRLGYEVCGREASGEDALNSARRERPDLILMDIRLSGEMDGISSAEAIREDIDIPVIFLTAYADKQTVERAKASDAYGYLLKPFQEREIEIAIDMAMYKHETEKRLRRQQALLDTTLESIPDAVITLDTDGKVVFANEAALELLGQRLEDLLGKLFEESISLEEMPPTDAGGAVHGRRVTFHRPRGEPKVLEMRRRSLEEPGGGHATVVVLRDMSLQLAYEERVDEARRAAEEASRSKSDFIANMSHELRTPMNSILGMSELALELSETKEQQEYLTIVRRSGEELLGLISNVLDFSRIEVESGTLKKVPFDLDELLEEIAQRQMPRAERKGLYLLCDIDPETPLELFGERESLGSILVNLVSNGLKFTKEGGVVVSVSPKRDDTRTEELAGDPGAAPLTEDGDGSFLLVLEVRDTGIGIPEGSRSKVFEAFTQIDPSATRDYGGTGIGLAVVRKLVDHLGGKITLSTAPEHGTTFRVTVPIERNPEAKGVSLDDRIAEPPELLLWSASNPQLEILEPWFRRWGVNVEKGVTIDSIVTRSAGRAGILAAGRWEVAQAPERFLQAVESGGVVGAIIIGEIQGAPAHPGIHHLGEPLRLRHLRRLLEEIPRSENRKKVSVGSPALSVLVVDDQALSRVATAKTVESKGHEAESVSDGEKALDALRERMRDVVLLDLEMPKMDGWETSRRIRLELPRGKECAIIAMTGHSEERERERARVVGMDAFVSKPVSIDELDETIRSTYARKRLALNMSRQADELKGPDTGPTSPAASSRLLEEAWDSLETSACEEAEQTLLEYRKRCADSKARDVIFKAVLACRRRDVEGAKLRLKGMISGG